MYKIYILQKFTIATNSYLKKYLKLIVKKSGKVKKNSIKTKI